MSSVTQIRKPSIIISAALQLISLYGIPGLTVRNISALTGLSKSIIYKSIGGRDQIIITILDNFKSRIEENFTQLSSVENGAMDKIEIILKNHYRTLTDAPLFITIIFSDELYEKSDELRNKMDELIALNNRVLSSFIKEG
ncbi:MAG: TetR/AcrR family transcriptional regulator [Bacteroidales bacterium]|nr:TetR/AcrR family transcriptional regulator [Bacteroidales bacterium]